MGNHRAEACPLEEDSSRDRVCWEEGHLVAEEVLHAGDHREEAEDFRGVAEVRWVEGPDEELSLEVDRCIGEDVLRSGVVAFRLGDRHVEVGLRGDVVGHLRVEEVPKVEIPPVNGEGGGLRAVIPEASIPRD